MTRALAILCLILVVAVGILVAIVIRQGNYQDTENAAIEGWAKEQLARDSVNADIAVLKAEKSTDAATIEQLRRERDLAQALHKPSAIRYDENVAHFDTAGIGAAIDSLNASPID